MRQWGPYGLQSFPAYSPRSVLLKLSSRHVGLRSAPARPLLSPRWAPAWPPLALGPHSAPTKWGPGVGVGLGSGVCAYVHGFATTSAQLQLRTTPNFNSLASLGLVV